MSLPKYRPPEDADARIEARPGEEVCDFCSATPVRWRFPARGHVMGVIAGHTAASHDAWAACDDCHALITSSLRNGLLDRSVNRLLDGLPLPTELIPEVRAEIRTIHDRFWSNREGAPTPWPAP